MKESQLARALLNFEPSAAPDPRQFTRMILEKDRRRISLITALTLFLWIAAVAAVGLLLWGSYYAVFPRLHAMEYNSGRVMPEDGHVMLAMVYALAEGVTLVSIAVGVLSLAALFTIVLVLASRRATLRQINASLIDISERLKAMRAP